MNIFFPGSALLLGTQTDILRCPNPAKLDILSISNWYMRSSFGDLYLIMLWSRSWKCTQVNIKYHQIHSDFTFNSSSGGSVDIKNPYITLNLISIKSFDFPATACIAAVHVSSYFLPYGTYNVNHPKVKLHFHYRCSLYVLPFGIHARCI